MWTMAEVARKNRNTIKSSQMATYVHAKQLLFGERRIAPYPISPASPKTKLSGSTTPTNLCSTCRLSKDCRVTPAVCAGRGEFAFVAFDV